MSTTQADQLWGVGCADASTCDAVGYSTDSNGANHTLIEALSAPAAQVPESALVPAFAVAGAAVLAVRRRRRLADSPA